MKRAARILALFFGLVFLGATLLNADLVGRSRRALASGVLRDLSSLPTRRFILGVILPETDDSFFSGLLSGISDLAAGADAAIQVFRYSPSSADEAERYFEMALAAKLDGLIMYVPRNDLLKGRLERATRAGVILIPVGTDAPTEGSPRFIGSGSLLQGIEGGHLICDRLGSAARVGVILPASAEGAPMDEPLYRGLATALKPWPGAVISAYGRGTPGLLSGEESAASMLRSHPEINALLCATSRDTIGVAQVVVDMNKVGRILIIGADETPELKRYIEKGIIAASVVRDSRRIGQEAVKAFIDFKAGRTAPRNVEAGFTLRTAKGMSP